MKFAFYTIIFSYYLVACGKVDYVKFSDGGVRPNIFRFELKEEATQQSIFTKIDTKHVYIQLEESVNYGPFLLEKAYNFIRFFENGRFFQSRVLNHYPTNEDVNNFNIGMIGYYIFNEDSSIVAELYTPGEYMTFYGMVYQDSVIFTESKYNRSTKKNQIRRKYRVSKLPYILLSKPFW